MRIGILTGGGDVPGLNPCIRAITLSARERGWEVIGLKRGWQGVLEIDPDDPESRARHTIMLHRDAVRGIENVGGTILHSSRLDPRTTDSGDQTGLALRNLDRLGVDALVTMGGDGTLRFSAYLAQLGVKVISVPKTMDNDVFGTDYCLGFSTAVTRSVAMTNSLRTTCASHERIGIVELFGRRSGETALLSGFLSQVERIAIAEVPVDFEGLLSLLLHDKKYNPNGYAICMISEGATILGEDVHDEMGVSNIERRNLKVSTRLARMIASRSQESSLVQEIGYLMRAGEPDAIDRMVGFAYGAYAVQLIEQGRTGKMVCLQDGKYSCVDAGMLLEGTRRVNVPGLYDPAIFRARLRDVEGMPMFVY
ncbi:6-phosphofructokinase [Novosphingobium malaysiense]|uniref:Phosphofructokinase n=1 Tax=Novosphingobium malaysiense TaxID=1348853 RepID=A0A0B1ZII6_9SPHN|nr:ATP-dependent 6-phosphofructokinase [Novosphingobium malaysiense]KHK90342.1 phosphofructokinase [Novosphingobium malaysiense]